MGLLPLNEVRQALSGAWELTRAGFWWRAAEAAANDRDWRSAATRCLRIADSLDEVPPGAPAWHQLFVATLDAAVRSRELDLVEAAVAQMLGHTYDGQSDIAELRPVFKRAHDSDALEIGAWLGATLAQRVPSAPWGHYAAAHFEEVRRLRGIDSPSGSAIVRGFRRAAELFGEGPHHTHAELRAAVAELSYTNRVEDGRAALRACASHAAETDGAWLAFGRTFSTFWLDRVRAADWIFDALDGSDREAHAAAAVALALCEHLPAELSDVEVERLRAVAAGLSGGPAELVAAQLDHREQLADHLNTPLAEASTPLPDALRALAQAWNGAEPTASASGLGRAVATALRATEETREAAHQAVAKAAARATGRQLAPVMLLLARIDRGEGSAELETAAIQYARRAPPPSCGFLPLAHRAFVAGMPRAGAALTRRAVEASEDGALLQPSVARAVKWACDAGTDRSLSWWLHTGERLLA